MFFPTKQETLEIQCNSKDLLDRLESATIIDEVKTSKLDQQKGTKKQYWFHGSLEPDAFKIALLLKRPNNFIPLVNGIIAEEAGKCNLVLHYELFPCHKALVIVLVSDCTWRHLVFRYSLPGVFLCSHCFKLWDRQLYYCS